MLNWTTLKQRLAAFREETGGTVSIEFVIMAPVLFWAFASMHSWFDAYRQVGVHEKAAFTVADMISRETDPIDNDYIDATRNLVQFLVRSSDQPSIRVSVIRYVARRDQYRLDWSSRRGDYSRLRSRDVRNWHDKLPQLVNQERIILVETKMDYTPPWLFGMNSSNEIATFIFSRPRFSPKVCWETC